MEELTLKSRFAKRDYELSEEDFYPPQDKRYLECGIDEMGNGTYNDYLKEWNEYISMR